MSLFFVSFVLILVDVYSQPECRRFSEIYTSPKDLCERMFSDAFVYETNESNAYTMWFFDEQNNPNNEISSKLGLINNNECLINNGNSDWKSIPSPESSNFTECHPWKSNSCCAYSRVSSVEALNTLYGDIYKWNRYINI